MKFRKTIRVKNPDLQRQEAALAECKKIIALIDKYDYLAEDVTQYNVYKEKVEKYQPKEYIEKTVSDDTINNLTRAYDRLEELIQELK